MKGQNADRVAVGTSCCESRLPEVQQTGESEVHSQAESTEHVGGGVDADDFTGG